MLKNYLKLAWRNLWKNKAYSLINICGLSLGLACCLLITLYLKDEWSFDRFHREADNLYQINYTKTDGETKITGSSSIGNLGTVIIPQLSGIADYIRFGVESGVVQRGDKVFLEEVMLADEGFFKRFSFPLMDANPGSVLDGLEDLVLTREMAVKYFGSEDVVGEVLELRIYDNSYRFIVSAVAENVPENSSIHFDLVINYGIYQRIFPPGENDGFWDNVTGTTFLLLDPGVSPQRVAAGIEHILNTHQSNAGKYVYEFSLIPLTQIHLNERRSNSRGFQHFSRPRYGYILALLAGVVMLIACLNYVNISLSQSLNRKREIGVRKSMGGGKLQLALQFGTENLLLIILGMGLAFVLVAVSLPWFNQLTGKALRLACFADWIILLSVIGLLLATIIFTSLKPALFAIRLNTVGALRNQRLVLGRTIFARSLVVVQFFLTIILIAAAIVINLQSSYWMDKDLGYNARNLLVIDLPRTVNHQQNLSFTEELKQYPRFGSVARGRLYNGNYMLAAANNAEFYSLVISADEHFIQTLQVPFRTGRGFVDRNINDSPPYIVVNEAFVKQFHLKSPIGERVRLPQISDDAEMTIIGVVEDYHYGSLKDVGLLPLCITPIRRNSFYEIFVRLSPGDISKDLSIIAAVFRKHFPHFPFRAQFQEDINKQQYQAELRWQKIVNHACGMAIFIACCGLLGLSLLSAQSRTREIGIRKVLGASVSGIVALLSGNFIKPVFVAVLLATPLAWYIMHRWLEHFAYRIELRWWMFALTGLLAVVIALLTVSLHSIKAALANPADSLGNE